MQKGRRTPLVFGLFMALVLAGSALAGGPTQAREALARTLGITADEVTIARAEAVTFTDGCMGLVSLRDSCDALAGVTVGTVTWLVVGDEAWRYHGSDEFNALGLAEGPFPASTVDGAPLPAGTEARTASVLPGTGSGGLGRTPTRANGAAVAGGAVAAVVLALGARRFGRHV